MKRYLFLLLAACLVGGAAFTQSLSSVKLTDTVVKGVGDINLLKDLTPAALEALRAANGGRLVLGVDVNEAANGTEKAASQGVAVADAWLEVTLPDGSKRIYGHAGAFWTETQALLAPVGMTTRTRYYTLLGESGSSRITSNGRVQAIFDSTLKIAVPDNIGSAVAAVLHVRFLDPNVKQGEQQTVFGTPRSSATPRPSTTSPLASRTWPCSHHRTPPTWTSCCPPRPSFAVTPRSWS